MIVGPSDATIDFTMVGNEIIEKAFSIAGIGSEGEAISADQYRRALVSLNLIVKTWGTSEHLWLRTSDTVTLVEGQATYVLDPKPMRVIECRRRSSSRLGSTGGT